MDEKNYVAYKLEVDDVGLKGKCSSEGVSSRVIEAIRQKIVQTSKNGGWIIFKKNGNQYEPCELYKP
jgi:hypothetical protein